MMRVIPKVLSSCFVREWNNIILTPQNHAFMLTSCDQFATARDNIPSVGVFYLVIHNLICFLELEMNIGPMYHHL